jgi:23S rRNA (pseudouridine1915-N3)-methyltransferase
MRLHLAAIGKLKSGPEKDLASDYAKRITQLARKAGISTLTVGEQAESTKPTAQLRMAEEAAILRKQVPPQSVLLVLDERGTQLTSEAFAKVLESHMARGTADLALVIGGPDGHDPALRKEAAQVIALGAMTWPHRLVRIMILEQVYRALTMMLNHPYHRA